jgi:hypothetical protein
MAYKPKYPPPKLQGINPQKRKIGGSPNNNFQAQERAHVAGETPQFDPEIKSLYYKDCLGWGDPAIDEIMSFGVSTEHPETGFSNSELDEEASLGQAHNSNPEIPLATREVTGNPSIYSIPNPVVEGCILEWSNTMREELERLSRQEGSNDPKSTAATVKEAAALAYRAAMPQLSNRQAVIDFIACVVHGMAIGAIPGAQGTQLLYGAQVANSAFPPRKKRNKCT